MSKEEQEQLEHRPTTVSALEKDATLMHDVAKAPASANAWLNGIVLWAALAVFSNAYNVSIIASSLGQPTFQVRFKFATSDITSLTAAAVGGNQVGGFFGQFFFSYVSDRIGRRYAIGIAAIVTIIGVALESGCANGSWAMFIVARVVVGFGGWPCAALALTYQSEVAITELRGWLTGTVGLAFGTGYALAGWVGVGLYFWDNEFAWRLPLLFGLIFPLGVLAGLPFVPETPRWLCVHGRHEEAYSILERMHKHPKDPHNAYARLEFAEVKAQADFDNTLDSSWLSIFTKPSNLKRFWVTLLVGFAGQNTAIQVITSYGPTLYAGFGFSQRDSLLIAAGWITLAAIEPLMCMWALDKFGRKPLIFGASAGCAVTLSLIAPLNKYYGTPTGTITAGGGALIAAIYLHLIAYLLAEAACYVYFGEIWPNHLRSKGGAIGLASIQLTAVWECWSTPYALANIGWKFWMVFVCLNIVGAVLIALFVIETKQVPLEEVAARFGDKEDVVMYLDGLNAAKTKEAKALGVGGESV